MNALRFHAAGDLCIDEDLPEPGEPGPAQVFGSNHFPGVRGTDRHADVDRPSLAPAGTIVVRTVTLYNAVGGAFAARTDPAGEPFKILMHLQAAA